MGRVTRGAKIRFPVIKASPGRKRFEAPIVRPMAEHAEVSKDTVEEEHDRDVREGRIQPRVWDGERETVTKDRWWRRVIEWLRKTD